MKSYFISDIHLKSINERNGHLFIRFLNNLIEEAEKNKIELFILGDLFDLWLSDHQVFVDRFEPICNLFSKLIMLNVPIHYFEGNHDVHIDKYFKDKIGMKVYDGPSFFLREGLKIRIEHGDYINPHDKVYHRYLKIIRHPMIEPIGHVTPGIFWDFFGQVGSKLSRKKSRKTQDKQLIIQRLYDFTKKIYEEEPFDVLITGHIHVREDALIDIENKKIQTINLGSWYEEPKALVFRQGQFQWQSLS